MNAYSKDLRLRVLDALDHGLPREEVSRLFGISRSTIKRWVKRRHQGEDLEPKRSTEAKKGASSPPSRRGGRYGRR